MGKYIVSCHCKRCGHDWFPRQLEKPVQCPKCKSARWKQERAPKLMKAALDAKLTPKGE